eukprot:TRINITY_DN1598_c0_g1_i1.p1 TRINITY_DN1598_c0_g1~~TRINITY_DN1598_c0_g1_i1.p1  ORF type:complete len:132 (-),score=35.88 TRINITY_DN1598_c0_g1_i1:3-398(-)
MEKGKKLATKEKKSSKSSLVKESPKEKKKKDSAKSTPETKKKKSSRKVGTKESIETTADSPNWPVPNDTKTTEKKQTPISSPLVERVHSPVSTEVKEMNTSTYPEDEGSSSEREAKLGDYRGPLSLSLIHI